MSAKVETPVAAYEAMAAAWKLIDALLGGTRAMRAAGSTYLPQEPKEKDAKYSSRIARSVLYGGYSDAVDNLVARPFAKPLQLKGAEEIDERLGRIELDADREGTPLTDFACKWLRDGINHGLSHVIVDYPAVKATPDLAAEANEDIRPYFVHVPATKLIGWRFARSPLSGRKELVKLRILDSRTEPDGDFGERLVEVVKVYTKTQDLGVLYEEWVKPPDKSVFVFDPASMRQLVANGRPLMRIPLVPLYIGEKTGDLAALPPLEGLAWLNLAHWQSSSDQRNILRFARCGLLFGKSWGRDLADPGSGADPNSASSARELEIGPGAFTYADDPQADLKYVEHSGKAIEAGRQDLLDLEEKMVQMGLSPLMRRTGSETATGRSIDEARATTDLQAWARALERAIERCFAIAAEWIGEVLPTDFSADVYEDWPLAARAAEDLRFLLDARKAGEISRETFLSEVKRRGLLGASVDLDAEAERLDAEGPPLGAMGNPFGGGPRMPPIVPAA